MTGFALFVNVQWSPYQYLVAVQQKMLAFGGSGAKRRSRGAGSSAGAGSETDAILTRSKAHSITARDSPRSVSERPRATHAAQPAAANARGGTWIVRSSKHNRPGGLWLMTCCHTEARIDLCDPLCCHRQGFEPHGGVAAYHGQGGARLREPSGVASHHVQPVCGHGIHRRRTCTLPQPWCACCPPHRGARRGK